MTRFLSVTGCFAWVLFHVDAFSATLMPATSRVGISSVGSLEPTLLPRLLAPLFSVSGSDKSHRRKKRSRRKKAEDDTYLESDDIAEVKESTTAVPSSGTLQPRKESPPLKIKDVRELVGSTTTYSRTPSSSSSNDESGKESSARASSPVTTSIKNLDSVAGDDSENDPLARLLADAKEMQAMNSKDDVIGEMSRKGGGGVGNTVRNIVSTIVTVDFFVVCALLVWFLAGIFCSYVIKDDTVQIAFNGIFQPVVQPALGVLMIAAISDAVLKGDDKKES